LKQEARIRRKSETERKGHTDDKDTAEMVSEGISTGVKVNAKNGRAVAYRRLRVSVIMMSNPSLAVG